MLRIVAWLIAASVGAGCASQTPTGPDSNSYRGTIGLERIQLTCQPNGFFYRCTGWVRLTFSPAIPAGYGLIVNVDESSLNNGFYDRGPYYTPANSSGGHGWVALSINIGGDLSYCPFNRSVRVNVIDARTGLGLTNGIPVQWDPGGSCG